MALTWAVSLATLATLLLVGGVLLGLVPSELFGIRELVAVAVRAFMAGGAAGALFAFALARGARGQTLATLHRGRVAAWGGLTAAALLAVLMLASPGAMLLLPAAVVLGSILLFGLLGAGMATAVVAAARRAPALSSGAAAIADAERRALPPRA